MTPENTSLLKDLNLPSGVSGFQTFKPVFCIYNKLRLHAEILS